MSIDRRREAAPRELLLLFQFARDDSKPEGFVAVAGRLEDRTLLDHVPDHAVDVAAREDCLRDVLRSENDVRGRFRPVERVGAADQPRVSQCEALPLQDEFTGDGLALLRAAGRRKEEGGEDESESDRPGKPPEAARSAPGSRTISVAFVQLC